MPPGRRSRGGPIAISGGGRALGDALRRKHESEKATTARGLAAEGKVAATSKKKKKKKKKKASKKVQTKSPKTSTRSPEKQSRKKKGKKKKRNLAVVRRD